MSYKGGMLHQRTPFQRQTPLGCKYFIYSAADVTFPDRKGMTDMKIHILEFISLHRKRAFVLCDTLIKFSWVHIPLGLNTNDRTSLSAHCGNWKRYLDNEKFRSSP